MINLLFDFSIEILRTPFLFSKDSHFGLLTNVTVSWSLSESSIWRSPTYCESSLTDSWSNGFIMIVGGSSSNEILIVTILGSLHCVSSQAVKVKLSLSDLTEDAS